jgi:hypothetical protein
VKQFDEGRSIYKYKDNYNQTDLHSWVEKYSLPLVYELSDDNLQMAMQKQLPTIILISLLQVQKIKY